MPGNFVGRPIQFVQAKRSGYQDASVRGFEHCLDQVGAETRFIFLAMLIAAGFRRRWIETNQAVISRDPDKPLSILSDVSHDASRPADIGGIRQNVLKNSSDGIVPIDLLIRPDPQAPQSILCQGQDTRSANA